MTDRKEIKKRRQGTLEGIKAETKGRERQVKKKKVDCEVRKNRRGRQES